MSGRSFKSQYAAFPQAERLAAWFTGWTRKAALLKATGESAERPLSSFDVDLSPTADFAFLRHVRRAR